MYCCVSDSFLTKRPNISASLILHARLIALHTHFSWLWLQKDLQLTYVWSEPTFIHSCDLWSNWGTRKPLGVGVGWAFNLSPHSYMLYRYAAMFHRTNVLPNISASLILHARLIALHTHFSWLWLQKDLQLTYVWSEPTFIRTGSPNPP